MKHNQDTLNEEGHYVVTAQPPGSVLKSVKCSFLSPGSTDIIIAKSQCLEVRQLSVASDNSPSLPVILSSPIHGRITSLLSFKHKSSATDYVFFLTDSKKYAVISFDSDKEEIITHCTGDLSDYGLAIRGNEPDGGPIAALEINHHSCIALHLYEGFVTILPIQESYSGKSASSSTTTVVNNPSHRRVLHQLDFIGPSFHCRMEERDVFDMVFLQSFESSTTRTMPQLAILHQDSKGNQHVIAHSVDLSNRSLVLHSQASIGSSGTPSSSSSSSSGYSVPLVQHRLKKSRVDGSSGYIVAVPPLKTSPPVVDDEAKDDDTKIAAAGATATSVDKAPSPTMGGILILGQNQITYHDTARSCTKILPIANFITLSHAYVEPMQTNTTNSSSSEQVIVRYLLGDDSGKIHVLALMRETDGTVSGMHLETLGVANTSSSLVYLNNGLVFIGSQITDSQLVQILEEPVNLSGNTDSTDALLDGKHVTFLNVLEEYINIGPVVDFQMVPTSQHSGDDTQYMAVTASGAQKDGSIRIVRNGIGMTEHAAVELGGIKGMWSIRKSFNDSEDSFILQSFVAETRILGVAIDDDDALNEEGEEGGATLAEMDLPGIDATKSTLFAVNVLSDSIMDDSLMIQITENEVRVVSISQSKCIATWTPPDSSLITVASANEAGQIGVAIRGGIIFYLQFVSNPDNVFIECLARCEMSSEVSCMNLNSFVTHDKLSDTISAMDIDQHGTKNPCVTKSKFMAIGLWDESAAKLLSLDSAKIMSEVANVDLRTGADYAKQSESQSASHHGMARSICLVTLDSTTPEREEAKTSDFHDPVRSQNLLFIGLGDGHLVSFVVKEKDDLSITLEARKEVRIGTRTLSLLPLTSNSTEKKGTCVLATGDKPTVVYLSGGGSKNARLCYSNIHLSSDADEDDEQSLNRGNKEPLVVNVASPFRSSALFDQAVSSNGALSYSLCISDDSMLRLGLIDDIQKLHITTHKLGMSPRRVAYDASSGLICVGCIDGGIASNRSNIRSHSEISMGNCVRFFDDTTFNDVDRFDLDDFETIQALESVHLKINVELNETSKNDQAATEPFLLIGTAYCYPEEDEPTLGRIIVLKCSRGNDALSRKATQVASVQVKGGVFSISAFYDGTFLASINSKTRLCKLVGGPSEIDPIDVKIFGAGHHGHIISLVVRSLANNLHVKNESQKKEQLAIVGDMVRSISVVKFYPEFETLEEVARDFNQNWITAAEMVTNDIYLGAENFYNILVLRRDPDAEAEETRCRLDTIGLFNLGEMVNNFRAGSLVTASNSSISDSHSLEHTGALEFKMAPRIGNQTMFATVDGTIGSIIGLDARTTTFFLALQRAMNKVLCPIGGLKHEDFRSYRGQRNTHASRGFIDGDLIESFSDLDSSKMSLVVDEMNDEGKWDISTLNSEFDDTRIEGSKMYSDERRFLTVSEVLSMVEDMSLSH